MKMKFILTVIASLAASGLMAAATNDLTTLLQRGLFEEEANHQLDAAIGDYKEAIEHFDHERQLAATAIFRLGECYRKLGRTNEANAQYERIVREFPDQTQFAQLSRTYLPAGAGAVAALAPGASALPPDEEKFLREVTESVQNSPDLVNEQLFTAAKLGYVSAADFLIAHGADVNMQYRSQLPLIEAATTGNEAMAKLLLKHGAAVNGRDHDGAGQTALICAVQHGFLTVCQTLVAQGADVNLQSPIVQAARKGNEAILHLLLSHGAAVDSPDSNGQTALSSAVADGFMTLCPALLAAGADVNTKDKNDWTPLHVAVEHGNLPAAKFLITNKAHLDAKTDEGQTPLFIAIKRSDTNMAKLLLDSHADANMETSCGTIWRLSPLAWAIYLDRPDVVNLLLEGHADPNAVITSLSASGIASEPQSGDRWDMARRLGFGGLSSTDRKLSWPQLVPGMTPLWWATCGNAPHVADIVKLLLDHGANPNTLDKDGLPPLGHVSHSEAGSQIEALLIKAGADTDYSRRRGIWTGDAPGKPQTMVFFCATNSLHHFTLFEFLDASYRGTSVPGVPFPDFTRVVIYRLQGKRTEALHLNMADFFQFGDCSKDVALQAGDVIEIPSREHKVAESWNGLSDTESVALEKCLLRGVRVIVQGTTNNIALASSGETLGPPSPTGLIIPPHAGPPRRMGLGVRGAIGIPAAHFRPLQSDWLEEAVKARKADSVVRSFLLDHVVHGANVLLNTSDLSRVRLTRGSAKTTFDLTANPPPDVWLEDGDVIEIPELGEAAPVTEAK